MRIQKFLSEAGIASRREAERLISEGRVSVNGKTVTEMGRQIDPERDRVSLDNRPVKKQGKKVYLLLFKPRGYVSTLKDERGRRCILDLLKGVKTRVFPVGRLDFNTEGLILLTNDGEAAQRISHPKYGLPKTYLVKISGILDEKAMNRLRRGVNLDGQKTLPIKIRTIKTLKNSCWVELTLKEGKKRQIRRMFEVIGHPVRKLRRTRIGSLTLKGLLPGEHRNLSSSEIEGLMKEI